MTPSWKSRWHMVTKWKIFRVTGEGNSTINGEFPYKSQWRGAFVFSLICAWIKGWISNRDAGDLRRHHAHYDVTVMRKNCFFFHPVLTSVLAGTRVTLLHEQHALMELRLWLRQMRVVAGDFSILIESRRRNRYNNCLSVGTWHGVCSIRKGLLRSDRHE